MMPHEAGYTDPATARRSGPPQPQPPLPDATPPGLAAAPDTWALLGALRKRWAAAVLLGGAVAAIAAAAAWYGLAPQATAYTKISVGFFDPKIWGNVNPPSDFKTFLQTTAGEIASKKNINLALKRDEVRRLGLESTHVDPAQYIEDGLKVEAKESSELVTILFSGPEPEQAKVIANAVTAAYFDTSSGILQERQDRRRDKVAKLEKLYTDTVNSVEKKKDSLKALVSNAKEMDPERWGMRRLEIMNELPHLRQQLNTVSLEHLKATDSLALLDARIAAEKARREKAEKTKAAPAEGPREPGQAELDTVIEKEMAADSKARVIQAKLARAEEIADEYDRKGFQYSYYPFRTAREQIELYRKQLSDRRAEVAARVKERRDTAPPAARPGAQPSLETEDPAIYRAHLQKRIDGLKAEAGRIEDQIKSLHAQLGDAPKLGKDYERLAGEIKREEEQIASYYSRLAMEKLEIQASQRITRFGDTAELMKADTRKQLLAAIAAPIAAFLAVCAALAWLECRKQRVRGPAEISRGLGIRVVGAVPRQAGLEKRLVGPDGECGIEGTPAKEPIDAIRTRLLHEADTRSTRVVMITSAGAGEGKTTLAAALATSLARAGRKTLLVDGDLRRPAVHQLFECPALPGFSEALIGEVDLLEAIQPSPIENLSLMPAGQWDREVLASLARGGLEPMFDKLSEEFDFILIDSHPVLEAADSLLIGRQADAVLLSVLSDVSQMPRVYAAQQQLAGVGIRLLGAVVSAADPEDALTAAPIPLATA
jgi:capsular exopolysaccharide synthesis family protein